MKKTRTQTKQPAIAFDSKNEALLILMALRMYKGSDHFNGIDNLIDELEKIVDMFYKGEDDENGNKTEEKERNGGQTCETCSD